APAGPATWRSPSANPTRTAGLDSATAPTHPSGTRLRPCRAPAATPILPPWPAAALTLGQTALTGTDADQPMTPYALTPARPLAPARPWRWSGPWRWSWRQG